MASRETIQGQGRPSDPCGSPKASSRMDISAAVSAGARQGARRQTPGRRLAAPGLDLIYFRVSKFKNFAQPESLSKTRVFERSRPNRKVRCKSGLNLSQNAFLISASQKARVRLSFERVHDDQTDKGRSHSRAGKAATSCRGERRASAINAIRCRPHHVETDADRLCARFDRRPESRFAARRADRSGVRGAGRFSPSRCQVRFQIDPPCTTPSNSPAAATR